MAMSKRMRATVARTNTLASPERLALKLRREAAPEMYEALRDASSIINAFPGHRALAARITSALAKADGKVTPCAAMVCFWTQGEASLSPCGYTLGVGGVCPNRENHAVKP